LAKSSRSRIRATVIVRASLTTSAVVPHLGPVGVEHDHRLLHVQPCVLFDLPVGQHRPLGRSARRIADPRRVVADDQDTGVTLVLEGAHPLERDRAADVDVGRSDVDAELHPQRPAQRQLLLELPFREHVDGVPGQLGQPHTPSLEADPG
jgi:hypothetical protein